MRLPHRRLPLAALAALLASPLASSLAAQSGTPAAAPRPATTMPSVTLPPALDRVLRDYERAWRAGDAAALAALFAEDGFVLQGGRQPVRGRAAIQAAYAGQGGGGLRLRAFAYATADTVGYIIGAYGYESAPGAGASGTTTGGAVEDMGKYTLTLRRGRDGRWLIFSDMDNASSRRGG